MADNVTLPGPGAVVATDDVSGIQFQKVKLDRGVDGVSEQVDATHGMYMQATPSEARIGSVGGMTVLVSANFNRPADTTAYAYGDQVGNSTTAGSVVAMALAIARIAAGSGSIRRIKLMKSSATLTAAFFRVHFFSAVPTFGAGDNAARSFTTGVASYLGYFDVTMATAFGDGSAGFAAPSMGSEINFKLAAGSSVYAAIEALDSYVPTSAETFTLTAEVFQD